LRAGILQRLQVAAEGFNSNTAILYGGLEEAVRENLDEAFGAHFLVTLKFDEAGKWKIVKTHQMSEKEIEKDEE
jgi:hypothetical protein